MNRNTVLAVLLVLLPASAWAQFTGYTGKKWAADFGIVRGTCDARKVADNKDGGVAMMRASRQTAALAAADLGCWGHALELADEKKTVVWTNREKLTRFRLTPTRNLQQSDQPCREFTFLMTVQGRDHMVRGVACRRGEGDWAIRS